MKTKIILVFFLSLAIIARVWRLDQILGFYFDQGRDALVIWDLWHAHKFFLIGPTTGIAGIFRGPWYYWAIAPWYLLGHGDPVWPTVFLGLTTVLGIFVLYKLAVDLGGRAAGFVAIVISSLSFYLIQAGRWLSNPTPMMLISMGILYSLFKLQEKKAWAWLLLGFLLGQAMQFGSSTEIFYFPAILVIVLYYRLWPTKKILICTLGLFFLAFLPQLLFDFRHHWLMTRNVIDFIFHGASAQHTVNAKLHFYYQVFGSKLFPVHLSQAKYFFILSILGLIISIKKLSPRVWQTLLILFCPLIGLLFFNGNQGNLYDYYFTGYYFIFVLAFSVLITRLPLLVSVLFLILFIFQNVPLSISYLSSDGSGQDTVNLGNSLSAVDWVFKDAKQQDFNVDFYVPPMIPYTYEYLFLWRSQTIYHFSPKTDLVTRLYTIAESDPNNTSLLHAWEARQSRLSSIETTHIFGGITAQRRHRFTLSPQ